MTRKATHTPLAEAMFKAGYSGASLGRELGGVHESQVSQWKCGHHTPSFAYRRRIAKLLGVTAASLWPNEDASS